jgi:hypothetical protein
MTGAHQDVPHPGPAGLLRAAARPPLPWFTLLRQTTAVISLLEVP